MKPDSTDTPQAAPAGSAPQWEGLDQLAADSAFWESAANEFPEGASEFADEVSRRRFIGLMGASLALAGAAGCGVRPAPSRKILPYTTQPDEVTPGVPKFYATAAPLSGYGVGIAVRSNEGRPTKIEGNPDHPSSLGGCDPITLATILDLYDPDRSSGVTRLGVSASPDEAVSAIRAQLYDASTGAPKTNVSLAILTETVTSPTLASLIGKLLADFPRAVWAQHDPGFAAAREGTRKAYGSARNVTYDFTRADVVLSLDADFLGGGPGAARYNHDFGERRKIRKNGKTAAEIHAAKKDEKKQAEPKKDNHKNDHHDHKDGVQAGALNRLYAVECMLTCTGSVADHRLALPSGQVEAFARALARKLGVANSPAGGSEFDNHPWIKPLADDLAAKKGKSVVVAGGHQPASLHALVAAINSALGNVGQTVFVGPSVEVPGQPMFSLALTEGGFEAELKAANEKKDEAARKAAEAKKAAVVDVVRKLTGKSPEEATKLVESAPTGIRGFIDQAFTDDAKKQLEAVGAKVTLQQTVIALPKLTELMNGRQVDVLLVFGVNAAYTAPADVPFADAVKNVGFSLHHGTHQDETAVLCHWHVNAAHYLEAWGDIRGHDGTATIQQPLIAPLYNGRSEIEFIAAFTAPRGGGQPRDGYDLVQTYWKNTDEVKKTFPAFNRTEPFKIFWEQAVRAGVVPGTGPAPDAKAPDLAANWSAEPGNTPPAPSGESGKLEINFRPDTTIYDGRFANNGWLQETPKPVTKLTWDNAAFMSPKTADALKIDKTFFRWTGGEHGRAEVGVVELEFRGRKVKGPVWILPGHADNAVTVHLGYGRARAGKHVATPSEAGPDGNNKVRGFNAYAIRTANDPWFANGLGVAVTRDTYYLACTQGQWSMTQTDVFIKSGPGHEWDRKPVRHGDLDLYNKNPQFARIPPTAAAETGAINENVPGPKHGHDESHANGHGHDKRLHELTMYYDDEKIKRFTPGLREEQQRRWAMAVDLNACTGCSACVVACTGENNIPVVGKDQVTKGRVMHWINVDRYYTGNPDDAASLQVLFQPRMCVQCENAPCEVVCPVGATVHSADGLNDMVYNRCVGTRYCSNNCPYKVRRFNFLTYADWHTNTLKLGRNPDVSVRSRGVMEKCTFCVQRIRGAEYVAERDYRKIKDGEILTACQSACPSGAIVFGDLNDGHSAVSRWKEEPRNYGLLAELNTRPRLTHLAIVRNPNPAMPNTPKGA